MKTLIETSSNIQLKTRFDPQERRIKFDLLFLIFEVIFHIYIYTFYISKHTRNALEKLIAEKIFKSIFKSIFYYIFSHFNSFISWDAFLCLFFLFFRRRVESLGFVRGETQLNRVLQLSSRTEGEKKLKKPRRAPVRKSREGLIGIRLDKFIGDSLSRFLSFKSIWK